jgi:hypothetical protein
MCQRFGQNIAVRLEDIVNKTGCQSLATTYVCKVDTRGRLTIMPVVHSCREPRALGVPSGSHGSIPGEDLGRCRECFQDLNLSFKYDVKTDKPLVPVLTYLHDYMPEGDIVHGRRE